MVEKGFEFNGKHLTKDFDCYIKECDVSPPKKRTNYITLPYMNGSYSTGNLNGEPVFEDRTITYKVDIAEGSLIRTNELESRLVNWLLLADKGPLIDDAYPGYYFNAECVEITGTWEDETAEITIVFNADPYMKALSTQGNLLWDTFNFETDYLQGLSYEITGTIEVSVYSSGSHGVVPEIVCNGPVTIEFSGKTYTWQEGKHKDYRFIIKPGENIVRITGEATVEFFFYAEVL